MQGQIIDLAPRCDVINRDLFAREPTETQGTLILELLSRIGALVVSLCSMQSFIPRRPSLPCFTHGLTNERSILAHTPLRVVGTRLSSGFGFPTLDGRFALCHALSLSDSRASETTCATIGLRKLVHFSQADVRQHENCGLSNTTPRLHGSVDLV